MLARTDEALEGYRTRIAVFLAFAQLRAGDAAGARDTFAAVATRTEPSKDHVDDTLVPVDRALALAGTGRKDEALKQARHAVDLYANDAIWRPYAEATLIQVQGMTGDREAALSGLETLLKQTAGPTSAQLRLDPMWDSFRGDPHFEKLAARDDAPVATVAR